MTDKVKLYVVRNDDGEYLMDPAFAAWFPDWTDDIITDDLYEHKEEAEETADERPTSPCAEAEETAGGSRAQTLEP